MANAHFIWSTYVSVIMIEYVCMNRASFVQASSAVIYYSYWRENIAEDEHTTARFQGATELFVSILLMHFLWQCNDCQWRNGRNFIFFLLVMGWTRARAREIEPVCKNKKKKAIRCDSKSCKNAGSFQKRVCITNFRRAHYRLEHLKTLPQF